MIKDSTHVNAIFDLLLVAELLIPVLWRIILNNSMPVEKESKTNITNVLPESVLEEVIAYTKQNVNIADQLEKLVLVKIVVLQEIIVTELEIGIAEKMTLLVRVWYVRLL